MEEGREDYWKRKRAEKRERKSEEISKRLASKQEEWDALPEAEKTERLQKFQAMKAADAEARRNAAHEIIRNVRGGWKLHIAIDFDFEGLMTDSELKSLAQQMSYVFATCRRTSFALWPSFIGFHREGVLREHLAKRCKQYSTWPIYQSERKITEVYGPARSSLIYLSPDSHYVVNDIMRGTIKYSPKRKPYRAFGLGESVSSEPYSVELQGEINESATLDNEPDINFQTDNLTDLHTAPIYVIGGFIDRNRYKNLSLQKATALGIAHARLPFDLCEDLSTLYAVLTINHVVDIFGKVACDGMTLFDAMRAVTPQRRTG